MAAQPQRALERAPLSRLCKPSEEAQALQQFQYLLQVINKHWQSITTCCVTPWLPDHQAPQPEAPLEVSSLRGLTAAMHSKCMVSEKYMTAVQQAAADMTARQAEQVQVLLYAMEDFSFADFIHLAVYHQRDIFAPSPVGMSPRTWHSDSLHPVLSTPHQQLSEAHFSSSSHKASKAARRAKIAHADTVEKAKLDAEMERLRTIKIPEMEKWAKLLQNGGLTRQVQHKPASMGTLAGLARLKRRAAGARRNLALQRLPKPPLAGSPEPTGFGGKDLALEMCRSSSAVLRSWEDKVFPGEGVRPESARDKTFSGLKGATSRQKAASSSGLPFASKLLLLPPSKAKPDSANLPVRLASLFDDAQGNQQSSQEQQTLGSAVQIEDTPFTVDPAEPASAMPGSRIAAWGSALSSAAQVRLEGASGKSAPFDASPDAVTNAVPEGRQQRSGSEEKERDQRRVHQDKDGAERQDEEERKESAAEQMEHSHLESPGRFATSQLLLMQQRQQQLQAQRLAALQETEQTTKTLPVQLHQQWNHQQGSAAAEKMPPAYLGSSADTACKVGAEHAQQGMEAETVSSSPVVLYSPGGPYSAKSSWYTAADAPQGLARTKSKFKASALGYTMAARICKVPSLSLSTATGKPGAFLAPLSRRGSLADTDTATNNSPDRSALSITFGRKGQLGKSSAAFTNPDNQKPDTADSSDTASTPAVAASKPARSSKANWALEENKPPVIAENDVSDAQQLLEGSAQNNILADSTSAAQRLRGNARGSPDSSPATVNAKLQGHYGAGINGQPNLPFALTSLASLPAHKSVLKSAASMYAASGVVDDLFTPRDMYEHGDVKPMTRTRHQFGLSAEQLAADNERQKEFASGLGAWYKSQLQRHARITTLGGRAISRSNSRVSE